jgi:c-di-GMP-binding flagellar brake protein YcgR
MGTKNNRSFFRINAMVQCGYRVLTTEEALNKKYPSAIDANYIEEYFLEDFNQLDQQIKAIVIEIGQKSHLLAKALSNLNSKINFMAQTVDVKQLSNILPTKMVNLSAGGIQLKIEGKIDLTNKVEILLQLSTDEPPIITLCDIVNLSKKQDGSTLTSLKYGSISEDDRRKLIYFVQNKEIEFAYKNKNDS